MNHLTRTLRRPVVPSALAVAMAALLTGCGDQPASEPAAPVAAPSTAPIEPPAPTTTLAPTAASAIIGNPPPASAPADPAHRSAAPTTADRPGGNQSVLGPKDAPGTLGASVPIDDDAGIMVKEPHQSAN